MIIKVNLQAPEFSPIQKAGEVIKRGGIIIFPTDTVYGLGCNAFHIPAIKTIFHIKERSIHKPLPVLINGPNQLAGLISGRISSLARELIEVFWPGALTLILPANERIPNLVTGGTKKIGVRMPKCKLVLDLISLTQLPLIGTSVNVSGKAMPNEMSRVIDMWECKVDLILNAGDMEKVCASTVVDLTVCPPKIVREGAIETKRLYPYFKKIQRSN